MKCKDDNCEISKGEYETAKRLNMHPEDVHYIIDVHMEVLAEQARASFKPVVKNNEWLK